MELLVESSHELPLVAFSVTLQAGCLYEPTGCDGLARICARMLRRGAGEMSAEDIEQRADALGAEIGVGVGLGASTVSCEVLGRNLDEAVDLVAQLLGAPRFEEDELGRLVRQTRAELVRSRDEDSLLCSRALRRHLFDGHPHRRRAQGSLTGLGQIDVATTRRFHRERFHRGGAIVAFAGDVDEKRAQSLADRLLGPLPAGAPEAYPAGEPPRPSARRLVVVDKPGRTQTQMAIGTLGTHPRDEDHVPLTVANTAFGGTFTSRLVQAIRSERGWSYSTSSHLTSSRVREAFSIWAAPAAEHAGPCLALALELFERFVDDGIDAEELSFCQSYLRRSWAFEVDTAKKRLQQRIERRLLDLPDDYHERFVERVEATSLDQANAAVRARLSPKDLWVSVVASNAELGATLADAIGDVAEHAVDPYDLE